ncbi:hypothetical protein GYA27_01500 [candidate division WWE3 bacterium]|uniref:DUF4145 domain-containing protein n=1 Tax=candidate division WWE3 bacterium TaxID=2053526 RepID=A0A7X9HGR0_UNCKA|nr:hypothetical protein [candidate division WWE3 bacterium]
MGLFNFFDLFSFGSGDGGFVTIKTERKIVSDWEKISGLLATRQPSSLRQALIIADRTFDAALKDMVSGESMGERLKNAKTYFDKDTYGKIWEAHKIRNNLVHESDYDPPYYVVGDAIATLKTALTRLRVRMP